MDSIRTKYEKQIISLIETLDDNEILGREIRKWYTRNKKDSEYETSKSFRDCNHSEEDKYNDYKNGLSFGMK